LPPNGFFCFSVPLLRNATIKLNERLSLKARTDALPLFRREERPDPMVAKPLHLALAGLFFKEIRMKKPKKPEDIADQFRGLQELRARVSRAEIAAAQDLYIDPNTNENILDTRKPTGRDRRD
jgi:hypothetical protein